MAKRVKAYKTLKESKAIRDRVKRQVARAVYRKSVSTNHC
jgi:hypothetical protein